MQYLSEPGIANAPGRPAEGRQTRPLGQAVPIIHDADVNRTAFHRAIAHRASWMASCLLATIPAVCPAIEQAANVDAHATVKYLLRHQKPNGAFGPIDQQHSDLAWNYPAVHALVLLGTEIPRREQCLQNGQWAAFREPDAHRTNLHWDLYQKVQLNVLLSPKGKPPHVFPRQRDDGKTIPLGKAWKLTYEDRKGNYYGPYGMGVYYDLSTLWFMTSALVSLGGTIDNMEEVKQFILPRQTDSGGFVDAYRTDPPPVAADAHLMITHDAVMTLRALGQPVPRAEACAAWIRSCQTPAGGFRWSPTRTDASNQADVWYTYAAVLALKSLGSAPQDAERCLAWLNSLQNPDGGFGDRPGWPSRLYSTYYAVHAIAALAGDAKRGIRPKRAVRSEPEIPEGKYQVFQAHLKAPALEGDSATAMVERVRTMRLDFIGAKTADVAEARAYAASRGYRLEIVACPENYPHKLRWLGGHPADHVSNWLIPPEMSEAQQRIFAAADRAGRQGLPWNEFRRQVIRPMQQMGTLFYPEMDYSMVNAYMVYDDELEDQAGYNAFIAALGWPAWDWVRHFPYRERWVGKLPALADGDAHGDVTKWEVRLLKQRTLYLAEDYRLAGLLDACRNGRTVCVIRDDREPSGVVYYGSAPAVRYVEKHRAAWQWWK